MKNNNGFTLIEALVAMAVLAILAALAAPSFQSMIASSRLSSTSSELVTTFAQAKTNAIRLGQRVTVCMSANGTQCATSGDWTQGWIMFNDTTHSGTDAVVDSGEKIVLYAPSLPNGLSIKSSNLKYVSYAADGTAKTMNGGFLAGTLRVCNVSTSLSNDTRARDLILSSVGRLRVDQPSAVTASCPLP